MFSILLLSILSKEHLGKLHSIVLIEGLCGEFIVKSSRCLVVYVKLAGTDLAFSLKISFANYKLFCYVWVSSRVWVESLLILVLDYLPGMTSASACFIAYESRIHNSCSTEQTLSHSVYMRGQLSLVGHASLRTPFLLVNAFPDWVLIKL